MFDPKKNDPYMTLAYHATGLKEVCTYLIQDTKVKPDKEVTINYYHAQVMGVLDMLEHMQGSIENYKEWNSRFPSVYGEDRED